MKTRRTSGAAAVFACALVLAGSLHAAEPRSAGSRSVGPPGAGDGRVHPAISNPLLRELPPDRSPYRLEARHGVLLARVRTADTDTLRARAGPLGVTLRSVVGGVATVEVPEASLGALARVPGVSSIKPALAYHLVNDVSTAEVGADALAAGFGGTGCGVIIAVIDTGLDFHHQDFRNDDGTTRVLAVWDQTDATGAGAGCGPGISMGRCWTKAELDADLAGGPSVAFIDGHGHGTHVAGTAAGNGRATAAGVPGGTYAGVAPQADLLIVKVFTTSAVFAGDLTAAYTWIANRAADAGKPFVINMSLGSNFGPHDGTDPDELSLDALLAPGLSGRAAAIAAGNSRGAGIHIDGFAVPGPPAFHPFLVPVFTPAPGPGNDAILFDLWYEGADNLTVSVLDPNGLVLATAGKGAYSGLVCTASGGVVVDATNVSDPDNHDAEVIVSLVDYGGCPVPTPPPSGQTMVLAVTGVAVPAGGRYHVWADGGLGTGVLLARFTPATETTLVGIPATSRNATTTGSYVTRDCWPNFDPNTGTTCFASPPIGSASSFSSNGPTRDERLKPEVSAPGERVVSSLSADRAPPGAILLSRDGLHWALRGTSMASPHVAGALALQLQFDPGLDAVQARQRLIDGARVDSFTGVVPNALYGHGKIGILGSAAAVLRPIEDLTAAGSSFSWTPDPGSDVYDVFRGVLPGGLPIPTATCFASRLVVPGFTDPQNPDLGTSYFYFVTGVSYGAQGSQALGRAGLPHSHLASCPRTGADATLFATRAGRVSGAR